MALELSIGKRQTVRPKVHAGSSLATHKDNVRHNRRNMMRVFATAALTCWLSASPTLAGDRMVGLITKTDGNPFFVTMKQAVRREAGKLGLELRTYAGRYDGDSKAQAVALESLAAAGAKGILITPSDPAALADAVGKAREAGVLVIALDTPFDPADSVDATFATDNFRAGELIGMWARRRMGDAASSARIATLDLSGAQITVDVLRNQGFFEGLRHRHQGPREDVRRGRQPHRRQGRDPRRRSWRTGGHGGADAEGSGDRRRVCGQRARGRRRPCGAEGAGGAERRPDCLDRRRLCGSEERCRGSDRRHGDAVSPQNGSPWGRSGGGILQDGQEAGEAARPGLP